MEQLFQFALYIVPLHDLQALVNDLLSHHFLSLLLWIYYCGFMIVDLLLWIYYCGFIIVDLLWIMDYGLYIFYIIVLKNIRHYCVFIFSKCCNSNHSK
jgi:hypothetical protein